MFYKVGAWGCFDEFNRLEERMLSAVSQQVQTIQEALKSHQEGDNTGKLIYFLISFYFLCYNSLNKSNFEEWKPEISLL